MCCRIFVFYNKKSKETIYINGPDSADKDILLKLYIDWYNFDFISDLDDNEPIHFEDFEYISYHTPIDFYDDYMKLKNNLNYRQLFDKKDNNLTFEMIRNVCNEN